MTRWCRCGWILVAAARLAVGGDPAMAGETVRTADGVLAYDRIGPGGLAATLVVVNGGPGLTHAYMVQNDVWARLARTRNVVCHDQRGLGGSTLRRANAAQTLEARVADLEALRGALGVARIVLLGGSFGGLIVLAYTLAHPEHVRRLVLSDGLSTLKGMVHSLSDVFPDVDAQSAAQAKGLGAQAALDLDSRTHMRECFYDFDLARRYLAGSRGLTISGPVNEAMSRAVEQVDLGLQLHRISAPTLILSGRFDLNVAFITAWRMAKVIPGARLYVFERSGHLPSYEEPDAYVATVEAFLASARPCSWKLPGEHRAPQPRFDV